MEVVLAMVHCTDGYVGEDEYLTPVKDLLLSIEGW